MKNIKYFTLILFSIILILLFSSCKTERFDTQNNSLGHKISLGMEKEDIDKLLGEPAESSQGGFFMYTNKLGITYDYGKASRISINGRQWETEKKLTIGDNIDKVFEEYGEEEIIDPSQTTKNETASSILTNEYLIIYYLDQNGQKTDLLNSEKIISFSVDKNTESVVRISISNGHK